MHFTLCFWHIYVSQTFFFFFSYRPLCDNLLIQCRNARSVVIWPKKLKRGTCLSSHFVLTQGGEFLYYTSGYFCFWPWPTISFSALSFLCEILSPMGENYPTHCNYAAITISAIYAETFQRYNNLPPYTLHSKMATAAKKRHGPPS